MKKEEHKLCKKCRRKLSYDHKFEAYECLNCSFEALDNKKCFDSKDDKYKKYSLRDEVETEKFIAKVFSTTPEVYVTKQLLIINTFLFFVCGFAESNLNLFSTGSLTILGGNIGIYTFHGEWWRLISSMFLHGGIVHFILNMMALKILGGFAERFLGSVSFFIVYMVSGIVGNIFSLFSNPVDVVGVGASGAIAGIFGGIIVIALKKEMPVKMCSSILKNAIFLILVNAIIGLSIPQIDNSAHVGGLLTGMGMTYFISQDIRNLNKNKRLINTLNISLVLISGALLVWSPIAIINETNDNPRRELSEEIDRKIHLFNLELNSKEVLFDQLTKDFNHGKLSSEEFTRIFEKDFIRNFKERGEEILKLINKADGDSKIYKRYLKKVFLLNNEEWVNMKKFVLTGDVSFKIKSKEIKRKIMTLKLEDFK